MPYTAEQVIYEAAGDIGAVLPGEALSAEDQDKLDQKYTALIGLLSGLEVYISDRDAIADEIFLPITRMLGNVAGSPVVGAPLNDPAWDRDLKLLRRLTSAGPTYENMRGEYF